MRSSKTPSPTGSTSPSSPRSSRLIRATTTPRIETSVKRSSQAVNSGSGLTMNTNKLYPIDYSPSNLATASHARPLTAKQPLPALLLRNSDVRRIAVCRYQPANTGMRPKANGRGAALGGGDAASGVVGTSARSDSGGLEADLECLSHIILFEYHQRDAPKYG